MGNDVDETGGGEMLKLDIQEEKQTRILLARFNLAPLRGDDEATSINTRHQRTLHRNDGQNPSSAYV
jgi:hypothetical protein